MKGRVEAYKRFEIHDGPGVRTTIFFKGCPLACRWCHNPECISGAAEIGYSEDKCLSCMECAKVCESGAHFMRDGKHVFDREKCTACGKCAGACLGEALFVHGMAEELDEVYQKATEDRLFFGEYGGVTASGGEALAQSAFVRQLFMRLKKENINTALDSCLYAAREALESVAEYTDIVLADVKAIDEDVHIRATGVSNRRILENLLYLNETGKKTEIRVPYVPGYNDDQMEKIAAFLAPLGCVTGVKVLAYHDYAASKYTSIGKKAESIRVPDKSEINRAEEIFRLHGLRVLS